MGHSFYMKIGRPSIVKNEGVGKRFSFEYGGESMLGLFNMDRGPLFPC
jgi:hypothetical protein